MDTSTTTNVFVLTVKYEMFLLGVMKTIANKKLLLIIRIMPIKKKKAKQKLSSRVDIQKWDKEKETYLTLLHH
jgi:hypothetical protein